MRDGGLPFIVFTVQGSHHLLYAFHSRFNIFNTFIGEQIKTWLPVFN